MNRRSFFKRLGILFGAAVVAPLFGREKPVDPWREVQTPLAVGMSGNTNPMFNSCSACFVNKEGIWISNGGEWQLLT